MTYPRPYLSVHHRAERTNAMLSTREKTFFNSFSDFRLDSDSSIAEFCRLAKVKGWPQDSEVYRSFWQVCFGSACPGSDEGQVQKGAADNSGTEVVHIPSPRKAKSTISSASDLVLIEKNLQRLDLQTSADSSTLPSLHVLTPATSIVEDGVLIRYFDMFPSFTPKNTAPLREEFDRLAASQQWPKNSQIHRNQFTRCCSDEFRHFYGDNTSRLEAWQSIFTDITGVTPPPPSKNQCRKVESFVHLEIPY